MKCTDENIDKVFQVLKLQMSDENGRGEFDKDSDLSTAVDTVIGWIKNEDYKVEVHASKNLNIIELDTVEEANKVDSSLYWWSERMSAKTGRYVFVLRQIKKTK